MLLSVLRWWFFCDWCFAFCHSCSASGLVLCWVLVLWCHFLDPFQFFRRYRRGRESVLLCLLCFSCMYIYIYIYNIVLHVILVMLTIVIPSWKYSYEFHFVCNSVCLSSDGSWSLIVAFPRHSYTCLLENYRILYSNKYWHKFNIDSIQVPDCLQILK